MAGDKASKKKAKSENASAKMSKDERARIISIKSEIGVDSVLEMENASLDDILIYAADVALRFIGIAGNNGVPKDKAIEAIVNLIQGTAEKEAPPAEPVDVHE